MDVMTPLALLAALPLAACDPEPISHPTEMEMTTWSIIGVDPKSGGMSVAVASCVPSFGDAVAALVPGKGAAATQAGFDVKNRNNTSGKRWNRPALVSKAAMARLPASESIRIRCGRGCASLA
jgi:Family of unknown function (DUF1028)